MADPTISNGHDAMEETLGRLSKKAGIKAAIVVDRATGAVLKTRGRIASIRRAPIDNNNTLGQAAAASFAGEAGGAAQAADEDRAEDEVAAMVWNFVNAAGGLVEELDTEDEMKLLRLRTKKQELVVVPNPKYLLIVVHDTPPA